MSNAKRKNDLEVSSAPYKGKKFWKDLKASHITRAAKQWENDETEEKNYPIQWMVKIDGSFYPAKSIMYRALEIAGWEGCSFTSHEAIRHFLRLGFGTVGSKKINTK